MSRINPILRTAALALSAALLLGAAALAADTGDIDPLVTLSYLTGEFQSSLTDAVGALIEEKAGETEAALQSDIRAFTETLDSGGQEKAADLSTGYETVALSAGGTCAFQAGTEILLLSGTAQTSAALSDITAGERTNAGSALTVNHLYIAIAGGTVTAAAETTLLVG